MLFSCVRDVHVARAYRAFLSVRGKLATFAVDHRPLRRREANAGPNARRSSHIDHRSPEILGPTSAIFSLRGHVELSSSTAPLCKTCRLYHAGIDRN
jgi:hypothetical protein